MSACNNTKKNKIKVNSRDRGATVEGTGNESGSPNDVWWIGSVSMCQLEYFLSYILFFMAFSFFDSRRNAHVVPRSWIMGARGERERNTHLPVIDLRPIERFL